MKILLLLVLLTGCSKEIRVIYYPPHGQEPAHWTCHKITPAYSWGSKEFRIECHGDDAEKECRDICMELKND